MALPPSRRPMPAAGPHVWAARDLSPRDMMLPLGAEDAAEAAAGTPGPSLGAKLRQAATACAEGAGVALLRGLPPEAIDGRLAALATPLGTVGQARDGALPPADLVLLSVAQAARIALVSAGAVHNAVLAADPALAATLHAAEEGGGVFATHAGVFAGLPPANPPPGPAGGALAAALADPALRLSLDLRPGDLLLLDPFRVWAADLPPGTQALPVTTGPRLSEPPFSRLIG